MQTVATRKLNIGGVHCDQPVWGGSVEFGFLHTASIEVEVQGWGQAILCNSL
jgi:hypothetical protein